MVPTLIFAASLIAPPDFSPVSQPIIGGATVPVDAWTNVVAVINFDLLSSENLVSLSLCTGVMLDSRTVLTAGHCLLEISDVENMAVVFGNRIDVMDERFIAKVADFAVHPKICLEEKCQNRDAFDFGIVTLADQVSGVEIVTPLVAQHEWDETMKVGGAITVVGFGATQELEEVTSSQEDSGLGIKREVSVGIRQLSATGFEFVAGNAGKDICGGDSGGPGFVQLSDGSFRLVGISSRGIVPCGTGTSYYGTVYAALPWIRDELGLDFLPPGCDGMIGESCLDISLASGNCQMNSTRPSPNMLFLGLIGIFSVLWVQRRKQRLA